MKCCPIEIALEHIGRKWAINIVRDMFQGKKRFNEFLKANTNISTKMLSARLKELEKDGIIEKKVINMTPLLIEYNLTKKGKALKKILYEMAIFSLFQYGKEVFEKEPKSKEKYVKHLKENLGVV